MSTLVVYYCNNYYHHSTSTAVTAAVAVHLWWISFIVRNGLFTCKFLYKMKSITIINIYFSIWCNNLWGGLYWLFTVLNILFISRYKRDLCRFHCSWIMIPKLHINIIWDLMCLVGYNLYVHGEICFCNSYVFAFVTFHF